MNKSIILIVVALLLLVTASQTFFTVHQTQKALVLQFGRPVGEPVGPGLHLKKPFIQRVIHIDSRILVYDAKPAEVLTSDKKALVVDNYAKWRIVEPLRFYRTVQTITGATARLDDIIYSQIRVSLGRSTLTEIVSLKRADLMTQVTKKVSKLIGDYGIEVEDVRIKRTDLPQENEKAIYGRMRAERERQAKQYRSEGQEEAAKITSQADEERDIILAEARREAEVIRGGGDARATAIYSQALKQSPEFYAFKRSLDAYEKSMAESTRVILTPENQFLRFFR
jgi:membrane protease subunit HflC